MRLIGEEKGRKDMLATFLDKRRLSGLMMTTALGAGLFALGGQLSLSAAAAAPTDEAAAPQASAQAGADKEDAGAEDVGEIEEIVVTGTSRLRSAFSAPLSVTQMNEEELSLYSFNSQADILRTVPGIRAEGGGGEVASNVFIRGLPSGGQYQFTPLEYDGIPAFSTFGLNSSAFDVYYRNDLGIERMEFVRGGVSNLFGPGSVAGIINYISKTGSDTPQNALQIETGSPTEGPSAYRFRADFASSGPLSSDAGLYYAISGYYRYDEGPLKTGLPTQGFQLRANIKKDFDDGSGSFRVFGQVINDDVQFFLPLPLDGTTRKRAIGNDGRKVFTVQTDEAQFLSYDTPAGRYETQIRNGVRTEGGSIGFALDKELANEWAIEVKGKYARYSHQFNLFLDGDGIVNVPETLPGFLEARGLPDLSMADFSFTRSGQPVPDDFLLFANRILDRSRPANDFTMEADLKKDATTGAVDHTFTLGGFFARAEADDRDYLFTYLGEFSNRPRLVDLTVTLPDGSTEIVSQNGLLNAGTGFSNNKHTATRFAVYAADQMETGRWNFDIGVRVERMIGDILREMTSTFIISDDPTLAPDLRDVKFGNGDFLKGRVHTTAWAASAGASYALNDQVNVYANFSRGFFFPQIRSVRFSSLGEPSSYDAEIIKQAELGFKFANDLIRATVAGFWDKLGNRANVDFVNAPGGGVIELTNLQSTRTYGVEATAEVFITSALRITGNLTLQDHKFTKFEGAPQFVGNELRRQPNFLANAGIFYDDGRFDFAFFDTFEGSSFANDSNSVKLKSFNIARLDAGYRFAIADGQSVRVSVGIFNLFNSDGITEGSPRVGNAQSTAGAFFVGRPILPRQFTLRARYDF
ncbi:MAG: TonB-dependent receptor [Alphaproteobacteria bacterium]|nr:MAG: TonB-dependent receptor [Alphaproteobacteria bacterium]